MKITKIINTLNELFPDAKCCLNYRNNYELLISIILSAQTTDQKVNEITKILFERYPNLHTLAVADVSDVAQILRPLGLAQRKAQYITKLSLEIVNKYRDIPIDHNSLLTLPGVGRKTANLMMAIGFNEPYFAVDTHVFRIAHRLLLCNEDDNINNVEIKLCQKFPKDLWIKVHHQMIFFGRTICLSQKPKCDICKFNDDCHYFKRKG